MSFNFGTTVGTNDFSTFSNDEKLNYALKLALNRVQTWGKTPWYEEPSVVSAVLPNLMLKNKIPPGSEIETNYYIVDPDLGKATDRNVSKAISSNDYNTLTIEEIFSASSSGVIPIREKNGNQTINVVNGATKTLLKGISKTMIAKYVYWLNHLTGNLTNTDGTKHSPEMTALNASGSGTYPDKTAPFASFMTLSNIPAENYVNDRRVSTMKKTGNGYNDLYNSLDDYYSGLEIIHWDDIENNGDAPASKRHPFFKVFIGLPTYSTYSDALKEKFNELGVEEGKSGDNIGFTNKLLEGAMGSINGYNFYISSWNKKENDDVAVGFTRKGEDTYGEAGYLNILYFLSYSGFILNYGEKNILNGKNSSIDDSSISIKYPPTISFIKYTGETFADAIISQGDVLPAIEIANDKDLFIDTSNNTIHRLEDTDEVKKWISIGGSGGGGTSGGSILATDIKVNTGSDTIKFKNEIGYFSASQGATGDNSTAMGNKTHASGRNSMATGISTTASGYASTSMGFETTASGDTSTAMGYKTTASGKYSTAMGTNSLAGGGLWSTAMGYNTTASGDISMAMGDSTYAEGSHSTAIGHFSKAGGNSTAIGNRAYADGTIVFAVGVGYGAPQSIAQSGDNNNNAFWIKNDKSAHFKSSISATKLSLDDGLSNTIVGYNALKNNEYNNGAAQGGTTGWSNTAVGKEALLNNTIGFQNIAIGTYALYSNHKNMYNIAIGNQALYTNNSSTQTNASYNLAIGNYALYSNKYGVNNIAIGSSAAQNSQYGDNSIAIGHKALYNSKLTSGGRNPDYNVGIGTEALYNNNNGVSNTAIGYKAGYDNNNMNNTICIGAESKVTASNMCCIGKPDNAELKVGIGTDTPAAMLHVNGNIKVNTGSDTIKFKNEIGYFSASQGATGDDSTAMGDSTHASGQHSTAMGHFSKAGNNSTAIGNRAYADGTIVFAVGAHTTAPTAIALSETDNNNAFWINSNKSAHFENDITAYSGSDKRLKTNVNKISNPLEKLKEINGYEFEWIKKEGVHSNEGKDIGVIAQEIEAILPEITTTRDNGYKAVRYEKLTAFLISCVKEQQTQIQSMQTQIDELKELI